MKPTNLPGVLPHGETPEGAHPPGIPLTLRGEGLLHNQGGVLAREVRAGRALGSVGESDKFRGEFYYDGRKFIANMTMLPGINEVETGTEVHEMKITSGSLSIKAHAFPDFKIVYTEGETVYLPAGHAFDLDSTEPTTYLSTYHQPGRISNSAAPSKSNYFLSLVERKRETASAAIEQADTVVIAAKAIPATISAETKAATAEATVVASSGEEK